ncbi:YqaJ viral recombinase family protein [Adlercreutzia sp. ZJ242]|uniref:YqaJ viral recombinase family protein n=1 Tax=Adlercreutzia sp. ZJ242 TaxID=2709409 RepID=UPI0013EB18C0|nr:YqaJ viral recombinase family protein [Adlercreutzia sp. ZJ242]
MDLQWNKDNTISIEPPKRPKKMTGTRFASVLGLNRWSTPFQMWCDITKAYVEPFEDTVYTLAGKAIEPKQIEYMREAYGMADDLIDPHDVWGSDPFKKTYGNFYTHPVFGGMWDALLVDESWDKTAEGLVGHTEAVLEFKTTKRAEDWEDDVPEYYALQAALYAWLLDCDDVIMVVSFLEGPDYDHPEGYVPDAGNTATREFKVSERYPRFLEDYVNPAIDWWNAHVETGESPAFDEDADKDYLKAMRTVSLNPDTDVNALIEELDDLQAKVDENSARIKKEEKRIKVIKDQLKKYAQEQIGDLDTCTFSHGRVTCKLARIKSLKVDERAMKKDGVYDKYAKAAESSRFTVTFA